VKLTHIGIDRFGVWRDLHLDSLSEGVTLIYGPNEAGKTTLLEFIRAVLYGFSSGRDRYLPDIFGSATRSKIGSTEDYRAGGTLDLTTPHGRYSVRRTARRDEGRPDEQVVVIATDGSRHGGHMLDSLRAGIDEATFNNVFAVGLTEMQRLGTLEATESAEMLYQISAGLDQVSLLEVMRTLQASRRDLLSESGEGAIAELIGRRDAARRNLLRTGDAMTGYRRALARRGALDEELHSLGENFERLETEIRTLEVAMEIAPNWRLRMDLSQQLAAAADIPTVPEDALIRYESLGRRLEERQTSAMQLQERLDSKREKHDEMIVSRTLLEQSAQIEALSMQTSWIETLLRRIGEYETEIDDLTAQLQAECESLDLKSIESVAKISRITQSNIASLRSTARTIKAARQQGDELKQQHAVARKKADAVETQIAQELKLLDETDLNEALETQGARLNSLRRRQEAENRLGEKRKAHAYLETKIDELVDANVLSGWTLTGLVLLFATGAMMTLGVPIVFSDALGAATWLVALAGVAACGTAVGIKIMLEKANMIKLDNYRRQRELHEQQLEQLEDQCKILEREIAIHGDNLKSEITDAQRRLERIETLIPLDSKRTDAVRQVDSIARDLRTKEEQLSDARSRWTRTIQAAGLPHDYTPKQLARLLRRREHIAQLEHRLERRREDLGYQQTQLDIFTQRVDAVAAEAQVKKSVGETPDSLIRRLEQAYRGEQDTVRRRNQLRREIRSMQSKHRKLQQEVERIESRRAQWLVRCGVEDERRLTELAARREEIAKLRERIARIDREIDEAQSSEVDKEAVERLLATHDSGSLESLLEEKLGRHETTEQAIKTRTAERESAEHQLREILADRSSAETRLQLHAIEKQLEDTARNWRVDATAESLLQEIRRSYERNRQPETLREASNYLDQLTRGRYERVWTPLGEDQLRVDGSGDRTFTVEQLSRGTREQLFLALRLALASEYARRGKALPLVFDDVLVNFDSARVSAAARTINEYAQSGRQILLFTCHEHIRDTFDAQGVSVIELPSESPGRTTVSLPPAPPEDPPPVEELLEPEAANPETETQPPVETLPEQQPVAKSEKKKKKKKKRRKKSTEDKPPEDPVEVPEPENDANETVEAAGDFEGLIRESAEDGFFLTDEHFPADPEDPLAGAIESDEPEETTEEDTTDDEEELPIESDDEIQAADTEDEDFDDEEYEEDYEDDEEEVDDGSEDYGDDDEDDEGWWDDSDADSEGDEFVDAEEESEDEEFDTEEDEAEDEEVDTEEDDEQEWEDIYDEEEEQEDEDAA